MTILFVLGRLLYGGFFLYSGFQHFKQRVGYSTYAASKKVPMPSVAVIVSGALIFLGGLGVIMGAYMQLSLWLIVIFLIPVTLMMHTFWRDTDPMTKINNRVNFFKNLALLGATLIMISH